MSGSASNMYWILPLVAGGCGLHVQHALFAYGRIFRACHSSSCVPPHPTPPHSTPSSSLHSVACIPLHLVAYSSPAGLSGSLVVLMTVGMITSIALFPIGIVLLIVTCCCCHGNKSSDESCDSSYHNPTSKCDRHRRSC